MFISASVFVNKTATHHPCIKEHSSITSARLGGLRQNADTADAGAGEGSSV